MNLRFQIPPPAALFGRQRSDEGAALEITASTLVADIAAHHPRSIEVFERYGIDICCGAAPRVRR